MAQKGYRATRPTSHPRSVDEYFNTLGNAGEEFELDVEPYLPLDAVMLNDDNLEEGVDYEIDGTTLTLLNATEATTNGLRVVYRSKQAQFASTLIEDLLTSKHDPGNSADDVVLDAYAGTKFLDEDDRDQYFGDPIPAAPSDTFVGTRHDATNFAGFGISAFASNLGQGYAIWEDADLKVLQIDTTPFIGAGSFFDPPAGAVWGRIAFQNRDPSTTNLFRSSLVWKRFAPGGFQFPAAGQIDGSFLATLVKAISTGRQPDGNWVDVRADGLVFEETTPLAAGEEFVSDWFDMDGFGTIQVVIKAAVESAEDGIVIEYTNDTSVADPIVITSEAREFSAENAAEGSAKFTIDTLLDGFRIRYLNGTTGQNDFNLSATARVQVSASKSDLVSKVSNTSLATMVRAALMLPDDDDDWDNLRRSPLGGARISILEHEANTPIDGLEDYRTGQANISSSAETEIMNPPLPGRQAVSITNLDPDLIAFYRETNGATQLNAGAILPLATKDMELKEGARFFVIAQEPDTPQSTATQRVSPTAGGTSGTATDPDNVVASDNQRAVFDAQNEIVDASGYDATAAQTLDDVIRVVLGVEARKVSGGTKTIGIEQTVTAAQIGGTSVTTTGSLSAVAGDYYMAFISVRDQSEVVQSVSGLGLTWSEVTEVTNTNGVKMYVYQGTGTPTAAGSVTVNFASAISSASVSALRISGVLLSNPFDSSATNTGSTAAWSATPATSQALDRIIGASAIILETSNNPGVDDTEHSDVALAGNAAQRLTMAVQSREATGAGEPTNGTWASAGQWAAVALALNPAPLDDPVLLLEYEVGAEGLVEAGAVTITGLSDAEYEIDVTSNRAWTYDDIDNIRVVATLRDAGTLNAEVDHQYVEYDEASEGGVIRIAFEEYTETP